MHRLLGRKKEEREIQRNVLKKNLPVLQVLRILCSLNTGGQGDEVSSVSIISYSSDFFLRKTVINKITVARAAKEIAPPTKRNGV